MRSLALFSLSVLLTGCGTPGSEGVPSGGEGSALDPPPIAASEPTGSELVRQADSEGSSPGAAEGEQAIRVLFLGTSLTQGLGLERPSVEAWPARVAHLADSTGLPVDVLNAGLGGETSAGTLRRLDWVMRESPDVLVLETGANDGLRGLPVEQLAENLDEIHQKLRAEYPSVRVALVQMEAPPNMGADYADAFRATFPSVAAQHGSALLPFLLEGVAGTSDLNQADGIHPTAEGHWIMARSVWPVLEELFRSVRRN